MSAYVGYTSITEADLAALEDRYRIDPDVTLLIQNVRRQARRIRELDTNTRRYHTALYQIVTDNLSHNDIQRIANDALGGREATP